MRGIEGGCAVCGQYTARMTYNGSTRQWYCKEHRDCPEKPCINVELRVAGPATCLCCGRRLEP